jgi:hypothetical protein
MSANNYTALALRYIAETKVAQCQLLYIIDAFGTVLKRKLFECK